MEDFDFLGDGTGSQSAPKSKFERDLEKFGDLSTLKTAKKQEEDRLRQAAKSYDISEKDDPGARPLEKPDFLKSQGNIDREDLITPSVPVVDEDEAEEYAAKYAAALADAASAAEPGKPAATPAAASAAPLPDVTYKAADVAAPETEDDNIVVVKDDDEHEVIPVHKETQHTVVPRQENGLPVLADLSDAWLDEAAKQMGFKDVVLSDREKIQLRAKEDAKLAKHLEKSLREKTRVSASQYTEENLRTANTGRITVFVCAAICIILGVATFILSNNVIIHYSGAILAVLGALSFIKLRFFARVLKFWLFISTGAFAFAGLLTGISTGELTPLLRIFYIVGTALCLLIVGILLFSPAVSKYYHTNMREAELQI
jgi:hypothetical protein